MKPTNRSLEEELTRLRRVEAELSEELRNIRKDIEIIERRHLLSTLFKCNEDKTKTADKLGITIKTLYNKLHDYGYFKE